jgi:hypothetical protein
MFAFYFEGSCGLGTEVADLLEKGRVKHAKLGYLSRIYPGVKPPAPLEDEDPTILWIGSKPTRKQVKRKLRRHVEES